MKNIYLSNSLLTILLLFVLVSCEKDSDKSTPPEKVTSASYQTTYGGAIITYEVPEDDNLLFVKAVYTNSLNEEVFKVSSSYNNTIEIDGFNDQEVHKVRLYAVGANNSQSEPYEMEITPGESYIKIVEKSLKMEEILGGVSLKWDNPSKKTVFVYVNFTDGNKQYQRILSSSKESESLKMRGLEAIPYEFSISVEDFYGNKTQEEDKGEFTPKLEQEISKSTWALLKNQTTLNGDAHEGKTISFFDNIIDTKDNPDDNSYFIATRGNNGGVLNFDNLSIVIDLNKKVILNRLVVWQRAYWYSSEEASGVSKKYFYYQTENMRAFDLYVSADASTWEFVKHCDIGDPKDVDGNVSAEAIQAAIDGHEFELDEITQPFRYVKIAIRSNYGSTENLISSEITLYGLDNQ